MSEPFVIEQKQADNSYKQLIPLAYINRNEFHNSNFKINQRGVSGTISAQGYFVDRWKLVNGTVTLTENGITLNGTISQILPNAIGTIYSASVGMYSGDATVSYNNNSSTGTVTSAGGTIKWVKLEIGEVETPYIPKGYSEELAECQLYFKRLPATILTASGKGGSAISAFMSFGEMRIVPTFTFSSVFKIGSGNFDSTLSGTPTETYAITKQSYAFAIGTNKATVLNQFYNGFEGYVDVSADL